MIDLDAIEAAARMASMAVARSAQTWAWWCGDDQAPVRTFGVAVAPDVVLALVERLRRAEAVIATLPRCEVGWSRGTTCGRTVTRGTAEDGYACDEHSNACTDNDTPWADAVRAWEASASVGEQEMSP